MWNSIRYGFGLVCGGVMMIIGGLATILLGPGAGYYALDFFEQLLQFFTDDEEEGGEENEEGKPNS